MGVVDPDEKALSYIKNKYSDILLHPSIEEALELDYDGLL